MIKGWNEALLYMGKAMEILEVRPANPSGCHLQMAIDLLADEAAAYESASAECSRIPQPAQSPLSANALA